MKTYVTNVVAAVSPVKGGSTHLGAPLSRSRNLNNVCNERLSWAGVDVKTSVGNGGATILRHADSGGPPLVKDDPATRAVVLVGEMGRSGKEAPAGQVMGRGFGELGMA